MDWERVLINFGIVVGFISLVAFWVGLSIWIWMDAGKRGLNRWILAVTGIVAGPVGLIGYILYRGNRPVLEAVKPGDRLNDRIPQGYDPGLPAQTEGEGWPEQSSGSVQAALESEERRFRNK